MSASLKVIFAGTPDFAASSLQGLINSQHEVVAVYTQPDRQSGRGKKIHMSPVKELALEHGIPVEQPLNFKSETDRKLLASFNADVMVVAAYGLLLPQSVLDTPRLGCINVHGSLLPRWRGAAPIQRAIQAGDTETGITIMQMEAGLDTGPMLSKATTPISADDTGATLHDKLAVKGADLLIETMDALAEDNLKAIPQDDTLATYAHKLTKQEAFIDWSMDATSIELTIRAFNSWPVAQTLIDGKVIRVWQGSVLAEDTNKAPGTIVKADKNGIQVSCGHHQLLLSELQLPGSRKMSVRDLLNAPKNQALLAVGAKFSDPQA
ncbi:methionyl-tRNA formyltransferase [Kangiella sediminilitoris]|uniref:Methionyl-tRNA formyltransferase n=1 Tax=Kangiella sediminilitoris TaxID=1144748 RepID=A0A1B3BDW7_9GAMM|nr:methionyl-tRNA formyltransferase [Kangiella sediminilitoris]AOE51011.1 Methionyl-tRNA formyltransferase [Kangiella sediminilitoris]